MRKPGRATSYKRVDDGRVEIDVRSRVVGWDEHTYYVQRVRNYTDKPIELEIRRPFPGHVVFRSKLGAKNHDYRTVQHTGSVAPGKKAEFRYEVVQHMGRNKKQDSVTVVEVK